MYRIILDMIELTCNLLLLLLFGWRGVLDIAKFACTCKNRKLMLAYTAKRSPDRKVFLLEKMHKNAIHDLRCRKILSSDDVILTAEIELFKNTEHLFPAKSIPLNPISGFWYLKLGRFLFCKALSLWPIVDRFDRTLALVLELLPPSVFTSSENWINTICSLLFIGWWWWYYLYQMVTSLIWTHNLRNLRMLNSIWSMFAVCWRYVPTCSFANCNIILFNSK